METASLRFEALTHRMLAIPRATKRLIALAIDVALCVLSVWFSFYLRLGEWVTLNREPLGPTLVAIALALPIFISFGLYRAIFRYAGGAMLVTVARAVALYAIPFAILYLFVGVHGVPRTVAIIQPILLFLMVACSRALGAMVFGETYISHLRAKDRPQVLIYGAGNAGRQLASAIAASQEMKLVAFVDDDRALWRQTLNGVTIHSPARLERIAVANNVTHILLAVPSASRMRRGEIVEHLRRLNLQVRTLPAFMDLAHGHVAVSDLRELEIEDLLGREPVTPDPELLRRNITGKTVVVTGAGGSIGSELCRQILREKPARLLLMDLGEYALYAIHQELARAATPLGLGDDVLVPLLGSVGDAQRIDEILDTWRPDTIFHAAAYKHVPLVEHNVIEGVRNNVLGTAVLVCAAQAHGVANFVLISTDKAVRPTNVMGASKRLAEMILQASEAEGSATRFCMVRFGNVLGSSGSVVPLFRAQVAAGGPVTVTHPEITRYFMTIPEAAQLVLQAGSMAVGGDVFVLDMGEPVRVLDLARNIIELSGRTVRSADNPGGDIEIRIGKLRPGEKLYEELLIGDDPTPTTHPRIMRSRESFVPAARLGSLLDRLKAELAGGDAFVVRALLAEIVGEFQPNSPLADWVSNARGNAPLPVPELDDIAADAREAAE